MTTDPKTLKAKRRVAEIPGKVRVTELYKEISEFTRDQIEYWVRWLPAEKVGNTNYYDVEQVEVIRIMADLIYALDMTPSSAVKLAKKIQRDGQVSRDRKWISVRGVQIGVPTYEEFT